MNQLRKYKIPLSKPWCDSRGYKNFGEYYNKALWCCGIKTKELEDKFSKYINISNNLASFAFNSEIYGIQFSMKSIKIQKEDEIILHPFINEHFLNYIIALKGIPIFCDIEYDTLNMDPIDIEKKITSKTKAIIVVHCAGRPSNMERIMEIAKKYNLIIIEDCSESTGGEYEGIYSGKKIGSLGNISYFSLAYDKCLPVGQGSIVINNKENKYITEYKLNDLNSIIAIAQFEELDRLNENRKEVIDMYEKKLSKITQIETPKISSDKNFYNKYIIKLHGLNIDSIIINMDQFNIVTKRLYIPQYLYPKYEQYNKRDTPITDNIYSKILAIPFYPTIKKYLPNIISFINQCIKIENKSLEVKKHFYSIPECKRKRNENE